MDVIESEPELWNCSDSGLLERCCDPGLRSASHPVTFRATMNPERLNILCVSWKPASPPRSGAQARMHGLMTRLASRHDLTAVMLVDDEFDLEECRRAMQT